MKRVPAPAVKAGDNPLDQIAKHRAALSTANNRIDGGRVCIADVREKYGAAH